MKLFSLLLVVAANLLFYAGVMFSNRQLLPGLLGRYYSFAPPWLHQTLLVLLFIYTNTLLVSWAYRLVGASWAGTGLICSGLITMVAAALLSEGKSLTPMVVAATIVMLAATAWLIYALDDAGH
ncbi:MAG: hypothetical protein FGM23_07310 [Alphaproteobacteria bacterium]|nr:hypothetical protein [Alphaproteobacteria bacterium]